MKPARPRDVSRTGPTLLLVAFVIALGTILVIWNANSPAGTAAVFVAAVATASFFLGLVWYIRRAGRHP